MMLKKDIDKNLIKSSFVYLEKDNKILLIQEKENQGKGLWCFPGGHLNPGETFVEAAVREVKEETGYIIKITKKFKSKIINGSDYNGAVKENDKKIKIYFSAGEIISGEMKLDTKETLNIKWFSIEEIKNLPLRGDWLKSFFFKIMIKNFYKKSILFWFVLLVLALLNATIRETTYKPLLTPYIGNWAHQLSSLTGITLFFVAIYFFLKKTKESYSKKDLVNVGLLWILMTILFECFMNICIRHLTFQQVLQTYYFWKGDTWFFVLLSLMISPLITHKILKRK